MAAEIENPVCMTDKTAEITADKRMLSRILFDGTVSADEIKPLLELSYQLTR